MAGKGTDSVIQKRGNLTVKGMASPGIQFCAGTVSTRHFFHSIQTAQQVKASKRHKAVVQPEKISVQLELRAVEGFFVHGRGKLPLLQHAHPRDIQNQHCPASAADVPDDGVVLREAPAAVPPQGDGDRQSVFCFTEQEAVVDHALLGLP